MKNKLILLLLSAFLLICGEMNAQQYGFAGIPYNELGFKGEIVNISGFFSGRQGCVDAFSIGDNKFIVTGKTTSGYKGELTSLGKDCQFTIQNGKLTKISYQGGAGQWKGTFTFTYTNDAVTVKENSSRTYKTEYYVDYSAKAEEISQQMNETIKWWEYGYITLRQYNEKMQELERQYLYYYNKGGEYKTETKTDKSNETFKYYNFKKDELGNVVSNSMSIDDKHETDVKLSYTYDSDYIGEFYWNKLKESTDLDDLEDFYLDTKFDDKYRGFAQKRWNELVASKLDGEFKNDVNKQVNLLGKRIMSENNRARVQELISEYYYPQAIKIRDFQELKKFAGMPYFTKTRRDELMARSQQLRNDSIAFLNAKAKAEMDGKKYTRAMATAKGVLVIAPGDQEADNMVQDAYEKIISMSVESGLPDEVRMKEYLQLYPKGKYKAKVEDAYTAHMLDVLKNKKNKESIQAAGGMDLINYVRNLPVNNKKLAKKVERVTEKKESVLTGKENSYNDLLFLALNSDFGKGIGVGFGLDLGLAMGKSQIGVGLSYNTKMGFALDAKYAYKIRLLKNFYYIPEVTCGLGATEDDKIGLNLSARLASFEWRISSHIALGVGLVNMSSTTGKKIGQNLALKYFF